MLHRLLLAFGRACAMYAESGKPMPSRAARRLQGLHGRWVSA